MIWAGHTQGNQLQHRRSRPVNSYSSEMASLSDSPVARPRPSQGKRDCPDREDESASKKGRQVRVWVDGW